MKKSPIAIVSLAVLLMALLAGAARAGSSAHYAINWQVLSGGGASASVGSVTLNGSIGQTAIGLASAGNIEASSGYWFGLSTQTPAINATYLPIIFKNP